MGGGAVGERGDRGVDVLRHDRALLVQPEVAQPADDLVGRPVQDIEVHRVTVRPAYAMRLSMCSPTRRALAMAVSAGFTAPMLGKKLVSTT